MDRIVSYILFICFSSALYLSVKQCKKEHLKYTENRLFSLLCFSSAIWSLGFFAVNIQTETSKAYLYRAIGIIGVFAYLTLAQLLVCYLSGTAKKYYIPLYITSILGFIICFFIIQRDQVTYQLSNIGMTYQFRPSFWNTAYIAYSVFVAINMLTSIIYMLLYSDRTRLRVLAKKLFFAEFVVVLGMVFDTILPLLGIPAVPGSTIGQFIGLLVMYQSICFVNRSRITIDNMSTYVYYSLTTPVLVYDHNYELQILNDVAYDFIGLNKSEVKSYSIDSLFSILPEDAFHFSGNRKDVDVLCHYNQLCCGLSISKIHDDYYDVIGYIITVTDLSERVESIARLKAAMEEAKSANQAKTTFLANMSHAIRTPMNAIIGFTELTLKKDISPDVREYIESIHLSSRNLLAIINDILDITKIESGKMELVPNNYFIADLLDDVSLITSQQAKSKGIAFSMKTDEHIPTQLFGDKVRIRSVLIHILSNAVKYTDEGSVSFEIEILSKTEDTVRLAFIARDTGIGIRPEDQKRLFDSLEHLDQQIHYNVEGSGLGLAIAKGYISLMGGEIKVDSVYGEGSVFTVIIDQKIIDAAPMQHCFTIHKSYQNPANTRQLLIHDVHVLLVDDNQTNLMVAKALLNSYGLTVDTAASGTDAISLCKNTRYPIIFMDQMMPEMDGTKAMEQIRKLDSYYACGGESKIIVLTADVIRGSREHLISLGFDEFLGKPINLNQLERLLIQYLPSDKISISVAEPADSFAGKEKAADSSEISYLKEALSDIDVSFGLENCGGSYSDYLKVLKINYKYGYKNLNELANFLNHKDYENYTIKIHAVKSSVKGIGAIAISDMARMQEEAGRAGDYSCLDTDFQAFRSEYEQLLHKIEEVLHHFHLLEETSGAADREMPDSRMLRSILTNIQNKIDNFAFSEVFEILEETKKYTLSDHDSELFRELEDLMDNLAVDEIHQLIANALQDSPAVTQSQTN